MKLMGVVLIVVAMFAAGIGAGYFFVMQRQAPESSSSQVPPAIGGGEATPASGEARGHGAFPTIPAGAVVCENHRIPELVCPFCSPEIIEEFGYCGGHDVAEALCTRCNPILIAAFKAEGDWCAVHGLPESQCLACNPKPEG